MIDVVALDLEGTLISNAVSQFPRPGLFPFLEELNDRVPRIVIFTTVSEEVFRLIARTLIKEGSAPSWFDQLEYIPWPGRFKDLNCIDGARLDSIRIVDDVGSYIVPEQQYLWLPISTFDPSDEEDNELQRVLQDLI